MRPTPFNPETDLAPMPFDDQVCQLALELKQLGLVWEPHVGCFVWDPEGTIKTESPFPQRIYFVLSLPRFIELFGSVEGMTKDLVWLPTWHQARLLCRRLGISDQAIENERQSAQPLSLEKELPLLYQYIGDALRAKKTGGRDS